MAMFVSVVITGPDVALADGAMLADADAAALASRIALVLVEAYDGEGVLAWRPSGVARTSAST